ncbi:MAG: ATP-dependent Clp protease ATP-binding subunit ClpX, partial [Clostridia bacterium]|nr:ATP-dependent Clp protease ATP-binding subunit ClpX [Clostridia bacterium]
KGAVEAIADMALKRNTGARGLRSIIEETMTDMMFNVPSEPDVKQCVVHKDCITDGKEPEIIREKVS